jgi:4-hydroxybutyryl-CoA dehydratase / vinylacetyl-CoA-Delta-isomerase
MYCCSLACSYEGSPNASGQCYVDPLLANVTKLNVTRNVYEVARLAQDIAGGVIATLPSEQDLESPEIGKYVAKYFTSVADIAAEDRIKIARLIEAMSSGTALVESMHGAGSPQAMKVMIQRQIGLDRKMRLATDLAGITESKETAAAKKRAKNG